jgi:hypothetical protein
MKYTSALAGWVGFLALCGIARIVYTRFKTWRVILPVLIVYYSLAAVLCILIALDIIAALQQVIYYTPVTTFQL